MKMFPNPNAAHSHICNAVKIHFKQGIFFSTVLLQLNSTHSNKKKTIFKEVIFLKLYLSLSLYTALAPREVASSFGM